ncbi:exonuclease V, chloroplastic isoform X3 [Ananas comosus]|nr:exonuclease V, chloroplastic isoform X3 [Ananas comosus]
MEFVLLHGKPRRTKAMKAGSDRHAQLENEVIEKVDIVIKSVEESWAVKFMNFIIGANQLLFEGLTRELPVIGVVEGTWMIGVIDEIRLPLDKAIPNPIIVDTKTRHKATLPSEAQKRNARLQLMCYKYLWDSLTAEQFSTYDFFSYFNLNPQYNLSGIVKEYISSLGFHVKIIGNPYNCWLIWHEKTTHYETLFRSGDGASQATEQRRQCRIHLPSHLITWNLSSGKKGKKKSEKWKHSQISYYILNIAMTLSIKMFHLQTLEDVFTYFRETCCLLPPSQEQLLLRYELQSDNSLLEEYFFSYDPIWFKDQVQECLKFWLGEREAKFVSEDEKWKCHFCKFTSTCPMTAIPEK